MRKVAVVRHGLIGLLTVAMMCGLGMWQAEAQQGGSGRSGAGQGQRGRATAHGFGFDYPLEYQTGDAVAVMRLQRNIEAALVRGDVAYLNGVISDDFIFVHGSGWTTGGSVLARDDKAAFLKRAQEKQYLVHDLDPDIKIEMHGNLAITYGRYLSLFVPPERRAGFQPRLASIWFERVFEKRDGKWMWISHRTVYGPITSPAGVDPTELSPDHQGAYVPGLPVVNVPPRQYPPSSPEAAAVLALDQKLDAAVPAGNWQFFDSVTADDFIMFHGDDWTRGGHPGLIDDKATFTQRVKTKEYLALDGDSTQVEMHGDVAIVCGRYIAELKGFPPKSAWFSVWFERIYQKRQGKWMYVSYKTVHGATHGPSREAVSNE